MLLQALLNLVPFYLFYISLVGVPHTLSQGARAPVLDTETDAFVNRLLREWNSPGGIAVAFVRMNEQGQWVDVETKGYGRATADGKPVTANTTFNIGSNSKVCALPDHENLVHSRGISLKLFTALATGLLVNNETLSPRLTWDSKFKSFVPEFNLTDPVATQEATILDMMTHRTGYPLHDFMYRYQDDAPTVVSIILSSKSYFSNISFSAD